MKPDGWEVGCRIGVLVPHADVGPESELRAMAPAGVGIFAARVPFGAMRAGGQMDPTISLWRSAPSRSRRMSTRPSSCSPTRRWT